MEQKDISPTPIYWDGESIIIGSWDRGDGLPALIPPADHKTPEITDGPNA